MTTKRRSESEVASQEARRFTRGRLSRGTGLRKTTGCLICRRRHIKCDEGRPECRACVRRKMPCEYASPEKVHGRARKPTVDADERNDSDPGPSGHNVGVGGDIRSPYSREPTPPAPDQQSAKLPETTQQSSGILPEFTLAGSADWHDQALNDRLQATDAASGQGRVSQAICSIVDPPSTGFDSRGTGSLTHMPSFAFVDPSQSQQSLYLAPRPCESTPDSEDGLDEGSPTSKWLDLLISDATLNDGAASEFQYGPNTLDIFDNSLQHMPAASRGVSAESVDGGLGRVATGKSRALTHNIYLEERTSRTRETQHERQEWESIKPVELQSREHMLFRHFVEHISQWMDLFDPQRPFGTLVPHLALHNVGLMNAILALSARHLRIVNAKTPSYVGGFRPDPEDTIRYYYRTLHYSQKAMQYDSYKTSLELLASSLIISSYEMLDGSSTDWEKHLKGVFWIQRSQVIHGDSGGLRQAVWWAWLCQDVWAAFREKRKPFTFWKPNRSFADMNPSELASRAVYNLAQVVGFCAEKNTAETGGNANARASEADNLLNQLEEWRSYLTVEFDPIPVSRTSGTDNDPFPTIWIQPAAFAVSMQTYYCSLILIHLHRPYVGGFDEYKYRQRSLKKWTSLVCGIASTSTDYASSIMSAQCVFIAALVVENENERPAVLELLESCSRQAGWPGHQLVHELKRVWKND